MESVRELEPALALVLQLEFEQEFRLDSIPEELLVSAREFAPVFELVAQRATEFQLELIPELLWGFEQVALQEF